MAVMVPTDGFQSYLQTDSVSQTIPNTYGIVSESQNFHYRFYAGWEASSKDFDNAEAFQSYLEKEIKLWNQSLTFDWAE